MASKRYGDWKRTARFFLGFDARLRRNVRVAMGRSVAAGASIMRKGIARKEFDLAPNAPSTIAAKGSSTPLADHGDLVGAIVGKVPNWDKGFIGITKNVIGRGGKDLYNVAKVLVEGATIHIPDIYPKKGAALAFPADFASSLGVIGGKHARTSLRKRGKISGMATVFAKHVRGHTIRIPSRDFRVPALKKLRPIHERNMMIAVQAAFKA